MKVGQRFQVRDPRYTFYHVPYTGMARVLLICPRIACYFYHDDDDDSDVLI